MSLLYNEVFKTCPECGDVEGGRLEVHQVLPGFEVFIIDQEGSLGHLTSFQKQELYEAVEGESFTCRECGHVWVPYPRAMEVFGAHEKIMEKVRAMDPEAVFDMLSTAACALEEISEMTTDNFFNGPAVARACLKDLLI